jgi:HlyD family secretion protein
VVTNKAQIAISSLDSIQMKFAPAIKKQLLALEMEKASVEKKKLQKKFAAQVKIDNSEVSQLRSRIMIQINRIKVFEDQQKSLTVLSPDDGIIMHYEAPLMYYYGSRGGGSVGGKIEVNSTVWDNTPVLQLPDMKEMQVSVEVPEADYKRIQNNQKVMVRVDASDNLTTTGKILRKTLAGKNNNRGEKTAIKNYEVIVKIDSCHLKMKPGLSASCQIIVDQLKDTIVVPSTAIFTRDSLKIIYVAKGEKFRQVVVETGLSNNSKSVITKGLSGNETIALMEPPFKLVVKDGKEKIVSSKGSGSKAGKSANDSVALR